MTAERKVSCPTCDGLGEWDEGPLPARSPVQIDPEYLQVKCDDCDGEGWIWTDRTDEELAEFVTEQRERLRA